MIEDEDAEQAIRDARDENTKDQGTDNCQCNPTNMQSSTEGWARTEQRHAERLETRSKAFLKLVTSSQFLPENSKKSAAQHAQQK